MIAEDSVMLREGLARILGVGRDAVYNAINRANLAEDGPKVPPIE